MTVNYSSEFEDDDFLDDTFRSIPENDLLSYSISSSASENPATHNKINNFLASGTSDEPKHSSYNTDVCTNNSLSFLTKSRGSLPVKQKEVNCSEIHSPNEYVNADQASKINSRFLPGFTPKAKKRKLPGPVGFLSENNDQQFQPDDSRHLIPKGTTADIEIQNITNSQFSSDDLLLSSWQNLQAEVSSCQNLLSTAKYYSIRRVLHETSKKKLPKHLVVPVLCVLIKKFNAEEFSLVFMDDTGEIAGKIDKDVFDTYKDAMRERTALILKRVTCICNILILKKQNVVSLYLDDGSVKHIQDLNSILDKEEPLRPMNCLCPGTPNEQAIKKPSLPTFCNSTPTPSKKILNTSHKMTKKVVTPYSNTKNSKENSCNMKNTNSLPYPQIPIEKDKVLNILEAMLDVSKSDCNSESSMTTSLTVATRETLKTGPNASCSSSASSSTEVMKHNLTSKTFSKEKYSSNYFKPRQNPDIVNNPSFADSCVAEDLFCKDTDDFDEILCSLDENSFLG